MGGDKPVRRCGTSRFFPPVGYRWKLDSLKARPPSRGTLARNPLPPPPLVKRKVAGSWMRSVRRVVRGRRRRRKEGRRERHDPFLQTSKFLPTTNYATPLASPSLVPPPLAARHPVLMRRSGSRSPGHPSNLICLGLLRAGGGSF